MSDNIRLRVGNAYDGDPETKTYRDATPEDAVKALRGEHGKSRYHEDASPEYHEGTPVYVVRVWEAETFVKGDGRMRRDMTYHAGDPIFGQEVTIYPRGQAYDAPKAAYVSWSSFTGEPAEATAQLELAAYATGIAQAANMKSCQVCDEQYAERKARYARLVAAEAQKEGDRR